MSDPEWQARRAETEATGALLTRITNQIQLPIAFS